MTLTTHLALIAAAVALYLCGTAYLVISVLHRQTVNSNWLVAFAASALLFHAAGGYPLLVSGNTLNLSLFKACSLIFWVINLLVLVSGLRKPLHNLFIFLFPLSAFSVLMSALNYEQVTAIQLSGGLMAHVLLSLLAYSLLIIATLQALLLAYQNHQLKHKHPGGPIRLLPPLQTMEALLFELLWAGEILLTLSILTGFVFIEDLFGQHLAHKTLLTLLAWCIYAVLLAGHARFGWRGNTAIRWTLGGFVTLMLAYFGSKFVIEILLN